MTREEQILEALSISSPAPMEEILSKIKEKTYIYLFEDGTVKQTKIVPTKEDLFNEIVQILVITGKINGIESTGLYEIEEI